MYVMAVEILVFAIRKRRVITSGLIMSSEVGEYVVLPLTIEVVT